MSLGTSSISTCFIKCDKGEGYKRLDYALLCQFEGREMSFLSNESQKLADDDFIDSNIQVLKKQYHKRIPIQ